MFHFHNKQVQEKIGDEAESQIVLVQEEGFETNQVGSEEMELNISLVLEKIENFTQRVAIYSCYTYTLFEA